jgi:predicted nuclease with TOPRIM domain
MNKKIECIKRLIKLNSAYMEMCEWLVEQKLTTEQEVNSYARLDERAEFLFNIFEQADENSKFQLVSWEWNILPQELIKITCVTDREVKEFSYGH